jgi:hypothetical protein
MLKAAFGSRANLAIIPAQDLLGLDASGRMNVPGVGSGNWSWRLPAGALTPQLAQELKGLADSNGRILKPVNHRAIQGVVRREAGGLAQFAAAFLVAEGIKAIETRDTARMKGALGQLKEVLFWRDVAAFSIAARATEFAVTKLPLPGVAKGLTKAVLPLAAGMAVVQLLSGQATVQSVLIGTGAFLGAGLAVNLIADTVVYPTLFAAGPPGWIAAGIYTVAKLGLTLYLGGKLEGWVQSLLRSSRATVRPVPGSTGVVEQVHRISP